MPQPFPQPSAGARFSRPGQASRRWAPNIPGSLTRALIRRLQVDATTAMRLALLYGDMEWQAGGASLLRYSASDYARRQGLHRQTVHADIRRLQAIGAIRVSYDRCQQAVLDLQGLGSLDGVNDEPLIPVSVSEKPGTSDGVMHRDSGSSRAPLSRRPSPCRRRQHPCRSRRQVCRSEHHPPGERSDQTLSTKPPTLEKGFKTLEKRRGEEESNSRPQPPQLRAARFQESSSEGSRSLAPELFPTPEPCFQAEPSSMPEPSSKPEPGLQAEPYTREMPGAQAEICPSSRPWLRSGQSQNPEPGMQAGASQGSEPAVSQGSEPGETLQPGSGAKPCLPSGPCSRCKAAGQTGASAQGVTRGMAQGAAASHRPTGACRAPEPTATAAQPSDPAGLLAELLEAFRGAAPAEWSTPQRLTLTAGRRSRLQAALAHAGSPQALLRQLRTALAQVPPWFRSTYPVRPDGSRRPSHQFFDVLFRASAAERDGGPEAWPVFSWSEAAAATPACNAALAPVGGSVPVPGEPGPVPWAASCSGHGASVTPAAEVDLQRAQRLFGWGGTSWLLRDIEALQISLAERRRLTALLESHGQGSPGAGARQFAEPIETAQPTALTQPTELAEPVTQPAAFTEPITQAIGLTQPEELAEPIECTQAAALTQPAGLAEAPELGQARELAPPRGLGQPAWLTAPAEPGKPSAPEACPAAGGAPTPVDSRQSPLPGPGSAPQGPWAPWPAPTGLRGL